MSPTEKPEKETDASDSPPGPSTRRRRKLVVAALLVIASILCIPANAYRGTQVVGPETNVVDASWQYDLAARLGRGEIAGRDFLHNFGPLYQVVHGLGSVVGDGSLSSVMRGYGVGEAILGVLCLWSLLGLTSAPLRLRALALLFWCAAFDIELKPWLGLLALGIFGRELARVSDGRRFSPPAFFLVPLTLLYSFELGVIVGVATFLATTTWIVILRRREGAADLRSRGLRVLASILLGTVGALLLLVLAGARSFIAGSWELASGYDETMALGFERSKYPVWLFFGAAAAIVAFVVAGRGIRRETAAADGEGSRLREHAVLLGIAGFALLWLRYALTRSDDEHVAVALLPTVFVATTFLPWSLRRLRWVPWAVLVLAVGAVLKVHGIEERKPPSELWNRVRSLATADVGSTGLALTGPLSSVRRPPGDEVYVWPYESIVALHHGMGNVAATVQSYTAHSHLLENLTAAELEKRGGVPVLLFRNSWDIDGVTNLSRTSLIFRYLVERHVLERAPADDYVVLRREPNRQSRWRARTLEGATNVLGEGRSFEEAGVRASDLLIFEIRLSHTRRYGLFKPGRVRVDLILSDGSTIRRYLLVPADGRTHGRLVTALDLSDPMLISHFNADRLWRAKESVTGSRVTWEPLDFMSRDPGPVDVVRVSVLERPDADVFETDTSEQTRADVLGWCFDDGPRPGF